MKIKQYTLVGFTISLLFGFSINQKKIPNQEASTNESENIMPFKPGEKLNYVVHYGIFNAGEAQVSIRSFEQSRYGDRIILNMVGKGKTTGAADLVFRVRDHYETFINTETMQPLKFIRRVDEGGYTISQDYIFIPDSNKVVTQDKKSFVVPDGVQDMVSAFYFARTLDFGSAKFGDVYEIPAFVDNEIFFLKIKFAGRETIKLRNGKYRCLKFNPLVQEGRIFKADEDLEIWVSDDKNKIPVLVKSKIMVGSIKMELTGYEGLTHKIARVK